MLRLHLLGRSADAHVVAGYPVGITDPSEYLKRYSEIAQYYSIVSEHGYTMFLLFPRVWLESCEDCHSGHWLDYD